MEKTMIALPTITILTTTYFPPGAAGELRYQTMLKAVKSWEEYLCYDKDDIHLCIADDGSDIPSDKLPRWFGGYLVPILKRNRQGVGATLNAGFVWCFDKAGPSSIILYPVDDWMFTQPFDITPWVQLLVGREDVGMVRLGPPHPSTSGTVEIFTSNWQGWGLRLDRKGFAFGHRPALYHKRFFDAYGLFDENCSALECERLYNERFVGLEGPDIVLALPHPWEHLRSIELGDIDPKEGK